MMDDESVLKKATTVTSLNTAELAVLEKFRHKYPAHFLRNKDEGQKIALKFNKSMQLLYSAELELNNLNTEFRILKCSSIGLYSELEFFALSHDEQNEYLEIEILALTLKEFRQVISLDRRYFFDDELSVSVFRSLSFEPRVQYLVELFQKKRRRQEKVVEINNRINLLLQKNDLWEARSYLRNLRKHDDDIPAYLYKEEFTKSLVKVETDILFITRRKEEAEKMIQSGDYEGASKYIDKHLFKLSSSHFNIEDLLKNIESQKKESSKKPKLSRYERIFDQASQAFEKGDIEEAIILCEQLIDKMPRLEKKDSLLAAGVHILLKEMNERRKKMLLSEREQLIQIEILKAKENIEKMTDAA